MLDEEFMQVLIVNINMVHWGKFESGEWFGFRFNKPAFPRLGPDFYGRFRFHCPKRYTEINAFVATILKFAI